MKMVMISYNSAIESEVSELLENCRVKNFTRWNKVQGKGKMSGAHLGTDVWPGENSVIFVAVEDEKVNNLLSYMKRLRPKLGKEGIKAFVWNLEEVT